MRTSGASAPEALRPGGQRSGALPSRAARIGAAACLLAVSAFPLVAATLPEVAGHDLGGPARVPRPDIPVDPAPAALLPVGAYAVPARPPPRLTADGEHAWWIEGEPATLHHGPVGHAGRAVALLPGGARGWWDVLPDDSVVAEAPAGLVRIPLDGPPTLLLPGASGVRWVLARPGSGTVLIAHAADAFRVVEVPLDGGPGVERFWREGVDDVVFDSALGVRYALTRGLLDLGRGVRADVVSVVDPRGRRVGVPFRQPTWVRDRGPSVHVGDAPVALLGGGDLATLGILTRRGFRGDALPGAWGDAVAWLVDPATGVVDAVAWYAERLHWQARTPEGAEVAWLQEALAADVTVAQRVAGDRRWLVEAVSGGAYPRWWRFDRDTRGLVEVGPAPGGPPLRPVEAAVWTARDGLPLAVYVTRPDPARFGAGPWPTVVEVHGGPWSGRHLWRVDTEAQTWAERGYATVAVNFRGTYGFGWDRTHSVDADFGATMIDDVEDAIRRAIAVGVADPSRVAMDGASYGGYAALTFATREEPLLRCAVAGVARSNLTDPGGGLEITSVRDAAWRAEHSPDRHVDRLSGPVLVWTGARDGANADAMATFVARATAAGKSVTWLRFPDEGHQFTRPADLAAVAAVRDRFLSACLGGPAWSFGPALAEATVEVRGALDAVPGLAEVVQ